MANKTSIKWDAVLAKNLIAEELAQAEATKELPNFGYIYHLLEDIERYTGQANLPSLYDAYDTAYNQFKRSK